MFSEVAPRVFLRGVCDHMSSGDVCRTSVFSFVRFSTENPKPLCFVDMVNRLLINHWKWGELNRSVGVKHL